MSTPMNAAVRARLIAERRHHWRRTRTLTAILLLLWFGVTFGTVFFARTLASLTVFGWPLSFYMAAQGASLVCLAILAVYVLAMRQIDRDFARRFGARPGAASTSTLPEPPEHGHPL